MTYLQNSMTRQKTTGLGSPIFSNATEDLDLKPSEEFDLLSGLDLFQRRVRSVHVRHPAGALSMVWERLEECYGSAGAMETVLFNKL